MRKLFIAVLLAVSVVVFTGSAQGVQSNGPNVYSSTTSPTGLVQCANSYAELGQSLSPGVLYIKAQAYRTSGYFCPNNYGGPAGAVATVQFRLRAISIYGFWYDCVPYGASTVNPESGHKAEYYKTSGFFTFQTCGDTTYSLEVQTWVYLQNSGGGWAWHGHNISTWPEWLDG